MEADLEKFMKMTKMKNADLDKELDDLISDDEELKQMKKERKKDKKLQISDDSKYRLII